MGKGKGRRRGRGLEGREGTMTLRTPCRKFLATPLHEQRLNLKLGYL